MNEKDRIKKELESLSPFLSKLEKKEDGGFQLPPNYFSKLEDTLLQQSRDLEEQESPMEAWKTWLAAQVEQLFVNRIAVGALASVIVVVGLFFLFGGDGMSPNEPSSGPLADVSLQVLPDELTNQEIMQYVSDHIDEFDTELIVGSMVSGDHDIIDLEGESFDAEEIDAVIETLVEEIDLQELERLF